MLGTPWTAHEIEILKTKAGIYSAKSISDEIGRPIKAVECKARRLSLSLACDNRRWSANEIEYLTANAERMTATAIGKALGRSIGSTREKARRLGLSMIKFGEHHHASKHTSSQVRDIRRLYYDKGAKPCEIAEQVTVSSRHSLYKIIHYGSRRHEE